MRDVIQMITNEDIKCKMQIGKCKVQSVKKNVQLKL